MKKKILIFVVLLCLMQTAVFAGVHHMEFFMDEDIVEINKPVILDLRVYDEKGLVIEDYQTLKEIAVGASDGSFVYWSRDEETLKPKLTFLPSGEGDVYLYALTRDGVKAQAMVAVEEPGVPTYVEGVRGSLHWKTVEGAGLLLSHDRMTIVDQYGRAFDLENPYYVEVKDSDGQVLGQVDEDAELFLASPKAGATTSYSLVMHDPDGLVEDGTTALYLTGIAASDIAAYELQPVGRLYGGEPDSLLEGLGLDLSGLLGGAGSSESDAQETVDENSDYAKDLVVKGFTADGEQVALDRFITLATSSDGDLVGFSSTYDRIYGQSAGTATIGLWHQLTRCIYLDVTVTSEAPAPEVFDFEQDYDYVVRVGTTLDLSQTLAIYDQYGVEITEDVAGQWFVDDPNLAYMNRESGILRGRKAGSLTFGFITETGKLASQRLLVVE